MVIFSTTRPGIPERDVSVETAGQLLVTGGDNPVRLRSEASFARLWPGNPRDPRALDQLPADAAAETGATAPAYFRRSFPSRRVAMIMATVPNTAR
jgi:hypothetical protein